MPKITDPDQLTFIVNGSPTTENLRFDTTTKTIELVSGGSLVAKDGVTGQCLFSKIKEVIKASPLLISVPLPVLEMIHDESMELVNGWQFKNTASTKMVRDCGVAYVNAAGATTAMFACFTTLGQISAGTDVNADLYFVQSSATDATPVFFTHLNTGDTFGVNELVQIYLDTNGDGTPDYDYRSYAKVFLRRAGYTYDESSNIDIGYPELTYKKYNFPVTHAVDAGVTVADGTLAGYAGMTIEWLAASQPYALGSNPSYNYRVVITGNLKKADEIYSWVQWRLRQGVDIDAGATNRVGKVTPALVFMDGAVLKTRFQPGVGGVHIANPSPASFNFIAQADDTFAGTYRTYPLSVTISIEFDSFLTADPDGYFWVFPASSYGNPGAAPFQDATPANIEGSTFNKTAGLTFAKTYSADTPLKGIAVGKGGAKIAIAETTLTAEGAKLVFVAGRERWYANP
jgi:hypothetical protein